MGHLSKNGDRDKTKCLKSLANPPGPHLNYCMTFYCSLPKVRLWWLPNPTFREAKSSFCTPAFQVVTAVECLATATSCSGTQRDDSWFSSLKQQLHRPSMSWGSVPWTLTGVSYYSLFSLSGDRASLSLSRSLSPENMNYSLFPVLLCFGYTQLLSSLLLFCSSL